MFDIKILLSMFYWAFVRRPYWILGVAIAIGIAYLTRLLP